MAVNCHSLGEYKKAQEIHQEALSIRRKLLRFKHPKRAKSLFDLASVCQLRGAYLDAEGYFKEALYIRRAAFKDSHISISEVLEVIESLASLYDELEKFEDSNKLYQEALQIRRSIFGKRHPELAIGMNNIAASLFFLGQYSEAENFYIEAIKIFEGALGRNHTQTETCIKNMKYMLEKSLLDDKCDFLFESELSQSLLQEIRSNLKQEKT